MGDPAAATAELGEQVYEAAVEGSCGSSARLAARSRWTWIPPVPARPSCCTDLVGPGLAHGPHVGVLRRGVLIGSVLLEWAGLPTPSMLVGLVAGIVFSVRRPGVLVAPKVVNTTAQCITGATVGTLVSVETLKGVGHDWAPVAGHRQLHPGPDLQRGGWCSRASRRSHARPPPSA